ncbi:hypothetical protein ACQY0O_007406 [Thecaphora frezii]
MTMVFQFLSFNNHKITQRNRQLSLIWSKAHLDALDNLLKVANHIKKPASKKCIINLLLKGFALLIDCCKEGHLVNFFYDLCKDSSNHVHMLSYTAMHHLSCSNPMLLKHNTDILVQLLQNKELTKHDLITQSLVSHLEQPPIKAFDVVIQDHAKGFIELWSAQ